MKTTMKASLATATLAVATCFAMPAMAGKDGYAGRAAPAPAPAYAPAYAAAPSAAGPCYFRSDVGYSWGRDDAEAIYVGNAADPVVRGEQLGDTHFVEAGLGCGMGSRGFRAEMVLGARGERKFSGDVDIVIAGLPVDPPIHTTLRTYTMMFNAYHDLGKMGGFVPYVGAGLGWAYHKMGNVTIDDIGSPNPQFGEDKLSMAWSLMAGVGYQISDRAVLDFGYRYIDLGSARSSHNDTTNSWNPRLEIDDLRAHELKVGLRYHFGASGDCCQQAAYAPMK